MERKNNIVIIGGTACGPKAGARARRCDQKARITIVEQGENLSTATCGLPYCISGVIENRDELIRVKREFFKNVMNIEVLTRTRALAIDRKAHEVRLLDLDKGDDRTIGYDKLVLATGSVPVMPNLEGRDLQGIFTLTGVEDAYAIRDLISSSGARKAVIVGAGLIGIEMAEAFASQGLEVTLVEALDYVLPTFLDFEIAAYLTKHLRANGVKVLVGQRVTGFAGDNNGQVRRVITSSGELDAGLVLLALGTRPNNRLAQEAGLTIGDTGGISVDSYLQTNDPDIYAGGDCVENVNRVTQQKVLAPLGSTANKHGRVIGTNVTGGGETFPGVLCMAIAKVFDYNVARVGLSELQARKAGYDVVTALVPGPDHAAYYPNGKEILIKLVAEKSSNRILGGQVVGEGETAKRIDVLATAITFGATVDDMANLDLAYAPPYNSAMDPLHHAANVIRNKQSGLAAALTPMEVKKKIEDGVDFTLLDVRTPEEWAEIRIDARQSKLLPLSKLRAELDTLPKDGEIVTLCKRSVRAYQAQRILNGAGFSNVKFMEGSIVGWPYDFLEDE